MPGTVPERLLLIFTRNPVLGKCKTRLAASIGDDMALEAYKFLLQHTVNITRNLDFDKRVYYTEEIWQDDVWPNEAFDKRLQQGQDLGERMFNAFKQGFNDGFDQICIIGSDMHDLSGEDIEEAFSKLNTHDYVIGPADDGGYYLLGMTKSNKTLFENMVWGIETVFQNTMERLNGESVFKLPIKNDVDRLEDIIDNPAFDAFTKHVKK